MTCVFEYTHQPWSSPREEGLRLKWDEPRDPAASPADQTLWRRAAKSRAHPAAQAPSCARRRQTTTVRIFLDHFHQFCRLAFLPGRRHHGMRLWPREAREPRPGFAGAKSGAPRVPLEIPSKPWPCTFLMLPTLACSISNKQQHPGQPQLNVTVLTLPRNGHGHGGHDELVLS